MDLFKLVGTIAINNSEANNQIEGTTEKASKFSSKLSSGIGTVTKWGTAIVGGAAVAGTALIGFATKSASTADNVDKMSQKIGISRQAYQELDFICSQSGTSVDTLQAGMKSLTSAMDGAKSGTKANVEQFERLGVAVTNSDGTFRSQEDVMWDTLSALQGMEDQTEKARLATELFGRSGTELMPLLNGASGSIDDMKKQAHDLGLVLDDELIDNGVNLTDSFDQTKRAFQSIGTQLGASLMPTVEQASDYIQKALPSIQSLIQRLSPIITKLLDGLLPPLMDLAELIFPIIMDLIEELIPPVTEIVQSILPIIVQLVQMLLPPIMQIVQAVLPILVQLITALIPLLQPIIELLQPLIDLLMVLLEPLIELLNLILPPLIQIITVVVQVVTAILKPIIEWLADFLGNVLSGVITAITDLIGWCADGFKNAWEGIQVVWSVVVDFFQGIWDGICNIFSIVSDWFSNIFENAWNGIQNVWNAVVNFFQGIWDGICNVFSGIGDWFSNIFSGVVNSIKNIWNGLTEFFKGLWEGIWNVVKVPINWIIDGINMLWSGIYSAVSGIVNSIGGIAGALGSLFGQDWSFSMPAEPPLIPKLAKGGVLPKGQTGYLEGDGAEAVVPLEQNTEWTQNVARQIHEFSLETKTSIADFVPNDVIFDKFEKSLEYQQQQIDRTNVLVQTILNLQDRILESLDLIYENMGYDLVLDTGVLVAETAPQMDEELGKIFKKKGRQ